MEPVKGMVLCTKNSQALTNAIVISVEENVVEVLSDFGNLMKLPKDNLWRCYEVSENWIEHQMLLEKLSITDTETLEDRISQQISKLQEALETIEKTI